MQKNSPIKTALRAIATSILGASLLMSANSAQALTMDGPYKIKSVIIGGYGAHLEVSPTPPSCTTNWEGTQIVVKRDQVNFKDLLAGFLSAQSQDKSIMIWHEPQGTGTCGFGNQQNVTTIQIKG